MPSLGAVVDLGGLEMSTSSAPHVHDGNRMLSHLGYDAASVQLQLQQQWHRNMP